MASKKKIGYISSKSLQKETNAEHSLDSKREDKKYFHHELTKSLLRPKGREDAG